MTYVKKSHTKRNLAIILIIIIAVASAAVAYSYLNVKHYEAGVKAGDTFIYNLKGYVTLNSLDATMSEGFDVYNATDYYMITITDVTGTNISMNCDWKFLNGTTVSTTQNIDVASGNKTDSYGFWAIYPTNLNKAELLRPTGYDGQIVNNTDTATYKNETRGRCYWYINNQFYDTNDPTQATLMYDYRNIFFDRETGMLTSLVNYQVYNNPQKQEEITWTLVASSVWQV
jgi:hypothetical protein